MSPCFSGLSSTMYYFAAVLLIVAGISTRAIPIPNQRQLEFMEMETIQFMHYGIPTYWDPPIEYLYSSNPTYHDCITTTIDHSNQTKDYYPCLNPNIFQPTHLDTNDWMRHSKAMGMKEICLTAAHEGGFCLWPTKYSNYSVAASSWRGGEGNVLREFVDSARKWGIHICYYLNVQADGYLTRVANVTGKDFIDRKVGMIHEVLTEYGPINRFWFDGTTLAPSDMNMDHLWSRVYQEIRTTSPNTIISSYRGDVCASTGTLYTNHGPIPNSTTDYSTCQKPSENGTYFHPTEMHGITIQEGPDGNTNSLPTYWFWHNWACAGNNTGCPWVGHGNASRIFDSYLVTVGHGAVLNMNIPPDRTGRMNASVAQVMHDVGVAINSTFVKNSVAKKITSKNGVSCIDSVVTLDNLKGQPFDYILTKEDLRYGQRIANYSIDYREVASDVWKVLVPVILPITDRPDGNDSRDQYVGHKRIDFPLVETTKVKIDAVRFNCHRALAEPVYIRQLSLHKKNVPWENKATLATE
eukprot:56812_1